MTDQGDAVAIDAHFHHSAPAGNLTGDKRGTIEFFGPIRT